MRGTWKVNKGPPGRRFRNFRNSTTIAHWLERNPPVCSVARFAVPVHRPNLGPLQPAQRLGGTPACGKEVPAARPLATESLHVEPCRLSGTHLSEISFPLDDRPTLLSHPRDRSHPKSLVCASFQDLFTESSQYLNRPLGLICFAHTRAVIYRYCQRGILSNPEQGWPRTFFDVSPHGLSPVRV